MNIEQKIFSRYIPISEKLIAFGFLQTKNCFSIEKLFYNNQFKAIISIDKDNKVTGKVFDLENDDEFLPLRVENQQGTFVGEIRAQYEKILTEIRDKCFTKQYFIYPQSNRICQLIFEKYNNTPEFLWETFPGCGVFRNPDSGKWYGAILDVDRSKLQKGKSGVVEVIDLKLDTEHVKQIIKKTNFYPAYHMNKKFWISIILDDSVDDKIVMELIEESHSFTIKKKK